jgi:hypothetical protein
MERCSILDISFEEFKSIFVNDITLRSIPANSLIKHKMNTYQIDSTNYYICPFCEHPCKSEWTHYFHCQLCNITMTHHNGQALWVQYKLNDPEDVYHTLSISTSNSKNGDPTTTIIFCTSQSPLSYIDVPASVPFPKPQDALQMAKRIHRLLAFT